MSLVVLVEIVWNLAKFGSESLNPVTTLLQHGLSDIFTFDLLNLILEFLLLSDKLLPMGLLNGLTVGSGGFRLLDGIVFDLVVGLGLALHSEENHLLLTHLLNLLSSQDSTDVALDDFG